MSPRNAPTRRTWAQRLVLGVGILIVLGCTTAAAGTAWLGLSFAHIDRVKNIKLSATAKGQPANYLIVGTDSRAGIDPKDPDAKAFLGGGEKGCGCTDTIMVLRVDPNSESASIVSFPRDLWVTMADNHSKARINSAHQRGQQVLIDTIRNTFGITINHYVEIDFVGFEKLVNAVGGIKLWFDHPVRDSHTGLSIPNTGCVSLNGLQAREFARSRYLQYKGNDGRWHTDPTADLGRITRQQIFIRRAISKAVSSGLGNPLTLNRLVQAGVDNVKLDANLTASDIISLGSKFKSFNPNALVGYTIPSTSYRTAAGADVQLPDMREAEPILDIFKGLPPGSVSPQNVDLTVLNGSQVQNQAADVAGALEEIGFHVTEVSSYPSAVGRTTVLYGQGGESVARTVARYLTGGAALVQDDHVKAGAAVLVTGTDFKTVHDQPAPAGSPDDKAITTVTTAPPAGTGGSTTTSTTSTTVQGYATGQPPAGVTCT
jgi:LCP family protein required for cell wall assembly